MKHLSIVVVLAMVIGILATTSEAHAQRFKPGDQTIAEIAVTNGNFTTLVAALACTDLVGAVANPDAELTVFAPTDAAFGKNELNADNICAAFDTETLATVLLYHVVGERRPSPSVINGKNKNIDMLAGGSIFPIGKGSLELKDNLDRSIYIIDADILASNGIIHVVDDVLLPIAP